MLDDMIYTRLSRENEQDEQWMEELSLRKQLKLQNVGAPAYEPTCVGIEHDATVYHPMPVSSYVPSGRKNSFLYEQTINLQEYS